MRAILSACLALCASPLNAIAAPDIASTAAGRASDWSDEQGDATAGRVIDQCLAAFATHTPGGAPEMACVDAGFEACTRENGGTMSQYDLNVCRRFSDRAWRARYEMLLARFDGLFRTWAQPSADPWKNAVALRFRTQERQWEQWVEADCEMRELASVGGTIHGYAVTTCEQRHIAFRTVDLAPLLEWWQSR
jgi:hypothetical protein